MKIMMMNYHEDYDDSHGHDAQHDDDHMMIMSFRVVCSEVCCRERNRRLGSWEMYSCGLCLE